MDRRVPGLDSELVQAAQCGRLDAFESLVRRHQDQTFRLCLRMLGDRADAEDAAQDVFVQVWRSLPRYRGQASFATWVYRITVNRCLDLLRARRPTEVLDPSLPSAHGAADQPDRVAEGRGQLAALELAVGRLTADQRAAFVLREVQGFSYQEIADILQISVGAVKSRLNRARTELVQAMKGWE